MSKIITVSRSGLGNFARRTSRDRRIQAASRSRVLGYGKRRLAGEERNSETGSVKLGFAGAVFVLVAVTVLSGAFYLYQVNDLATRGFEVRDLERQIVELKKENEDKRIKEVELRSMYNIEKSTNDLDLVSSNEATYLELGGPVAMK